MWKAALIVSLLIALVSVYVNQKLHQYNIFCSSEQIINHLHTSLCSKNSSLGTTIATSFELNPPLCEILCQPKLDIECQSYHLSKPSVFIIKHQSTFNPTRMVVKQVGEYEELGEDLDNYSNPEHQPPTKEEFEQMIFFHINLMIGSASSNITALQHLFYTSFIENSTENYKLFWKVFNNHEYLYLYIFEHLKIFPRLYGTCEDLYAVELVELPWINVQCSDNSTYINYLEQMISLIQYVETLANIWEEPFELCDVKPEHFGKSKDGHIVFLDLDSVETHSGLKSIMELEPACQNDEDCSYFDCLGKCLPVGHCQTERVNTNLQVVCQKIFGGYSDISSYVSSFFSSCFATSFLKEAITLCSTNPGMSTQVLLDSIWEEISRVQ